MSGYTKLFNSIITSTIWREPPAVCKVWITMLALADRDGVIEASVPGLADLCRVTLEETEAALRRFLSPDQYSRSSEHAGRRIEPIDGGWRLVNHDKYQYKLSKEDKLERDRRRQQRHRERERAECHAKSVTECDSCDMSRDVTEVAHTSESVSIPESEEKPKTKGASAFVVPDWIPVDSWEAFLEMRKKQRKAPTDKAKAMIIEKLDGFRKAGQSVKASLDQSTISGWAGVYEPKGKSQAANQFVGESPSDGFGEILSRPAPAWAERRQ